MLERKTNNISIVKHRCLIYKIYTFGVRGHMFDSMSHLFFHFLDSMGT